MSDGVPLKMEGTSDLQNDLSGLTCNLSGQSDDSPQA